MIRRTLLRAAPAAMRHVWGGREVAISASRVVEIRKQLVANPRTRGLFFDEDQWKEFARTYAGEVVSAHANDMWQMDMTRCDVMVVDPERGDMFRPRIHAIIDVYSGCVPGLAFAREEDQTQTDLALLRALVPKPEPWHSRWPVWGIPKRMYWDNGRTYKSAHAQRILSALGVEDLHSRPRVSHTRGRVERFFGTFHGLERALTGYVGADASSRSTETIRRLQKRTQRWLETGDDPGEGERLLTIDE